MEVTGRLARIRRFLEDIPDEELESGRYFTRQNNIWTNGEFHIDARTVTVKDNKQKHRKKGDSYWKIDLQQCAQSNDRGGSKKLAGDGAKSNRNQKPGSVPVQTSGFGLTYGVVLVHESLNAKGKAPNALAFKTAMLYSCADANNADRAYGTWKCETLPVLFQEDRSWIDEKADIRHDESEYINKDSNQIKMPVHNEEENDTKDSKDKKAKGGKKNKK